MFLDVSQSREFPGLLDGKYICRLLFVVSFPWEKLLKILPHFQGPAWVLVLQSQKDQPRTKALGSVCRHQRTSMTMWRSCRADCECGAGLWQCLCLWNPFKPVLQQTPMSHLCLPAATAQMPQVPSLQTAVSGEAPTEAAFNLGWSLGDAGNYFISLFSIYSFSFWWGCSEFPLAYTSSMEFIWAALKPLWEENVKGLGAICPANLTLLPLSRACLNGMPWF